MNRLKTNSDASTQIAFLLVPEFALMTFCSACEPLRVANRLTGTAIYEWRLVSVDGQPVISSNGMVSQVDGSLAQLSELDLLIVVSSFNPQLAISNTLVKTLKTIAARGSVICGLDTGAYILARAGLLDGHKATIHWEDLTNLTQTFPQINVVSSRYVIDNKRITAAGATASMDLILELIATQHGNQLAVQIAEQFIYTPQKHLNKAQRLPISERLGIDNPYVVEAISLMENHLEDNLTTVQIASLCNISLRQLERLFRQTLKTTPGSWYRQLKLKNARIQLRQSQYSIAEIAANNGFESSTSFSRAYKAQYHCSPSQQRRSSRRSNTVG